MRDTVYNFFRAVPGDGPGDGILRSGGNRQRKRKADVISHNDKTPVSIQFKINIFVGDVQEYVYENNRGKKPNFLVFKYVPRSIIVNGNTTPDVHEFIEAFEESNPSFKVSLDTSRIKTHKSVENMTFCRINEITIMNKKVNNILIQISDTNDSPARLDMKRTSLSFTIHAELTPEQTHGKVLF